MCINYLFIHSSKILCSCSLIIVLPFSRYVIYQEKVLVLMMMRCGKVYTCQKPHYRLLVLRLTLGVFIQPYRISPLGYYPMRRFTEGRRSHSIGEQWSDGMLMHSALQIGANDRISRSSLHFRQTILNHRIGCSTVMLIHYHCFVMFYFGHAQETRPRVLPPSMQAQRPRTQGLCLPGRPRNVSTDIRNLIILLFSLSCALEGGWGVGLGRQGVCSYY